MASTMEEGVLGLVGALLSGVNEQRKAAEARLASMGTMPGAYGWCFEGLGFVTAPGVVPGCWLLVLWGCITRGGVGPAVSLLSGFGVALVKLISSQQQPVPIRQVRKRSVGASTSR